MSKRSVGLSALLSFTFIALAASAYAGGGPLPLGRATKTRQLTYHAYYDGHKDAYLVTDVSSKTQARALHINYAAELRHAKGAPAGGPWFVREYRILSRRAGIGRDYATLAAASRLARVVIKNPVPEDSRAAVDALLAQALAAFARPGARPDLVFFKSLYCLARDEGLPLKQHWLPSLPPGDRMLVAASLSLPSDAADAPGPQDLARLTKRLEAYLSTEADLQIG